MEEVELVLGAPSSQVKAYSGCQVNMKLTILFPLQK